MPNYSNSIYLPGNSSLYIAESQQEQEARKGSLASQIDTISKATKKEAIVASQVSSHRVELPAPKPQGGDYLEALAKGFSSVYSCLSQTTESQTSSFAQLQELDQSMSKAVNDSIQNSITKSNDEFQKQQAIQKAIKEQADQQGLLNKICYGIGAVLIAITVVSAICDAGASFAAVPEELELVDLPAAGAAGSGNAASSAGELSSFMSNVDMDDPDALAQPMEESNLSSNNLDSDVDEETDDVDSRVQKSMEDTDRMMEKDPDQLTDQQQYDEMQKDSSLKSNDENIKSENNWEKARKVFRNKWMKRCVGLGGVAVSATPQGMHAFFLFQQASFKKTLAKAQTDLGTALARVQENNMYFQFYQQLVQRQSGIVQQFAGELSDVVSTVSDIMSAYRQIPTTLAQAV